MLKTVRALLRHRDQGRERPPGWYDEAYRKKDTTYHRHYTESSDYFLWTVLVDRIARDARVLEIGCGPGQLALYLSDTGVQRYHGLDFSPEAVAMAQAVCPGLRFAADDALTSPLLDEEWYDTVIATEVLEHIERDLDLLMRVRPGVRCLLTVPNFPYPSHVRHFRNGEEVEARYRRILPGLRVTEIPKNPRGGRFFLIDGIRSE